MKASHTLANWFDVRPNEVRTVTLSMAGAFLVIAFMVVVRSLREALYLTTFDVKTLPYITAAVAVLSLPAVGAFARLLARHHPKSVLRWLVLLLGGGLALLWPVATRHPVAIVVFYLWTALGTLLLTSGFWIVTSEYFPVRGAKRLYGLIGAGGTAGAMAMGMSLSWLTRIWETGWLLSLPLGVLVCFLMVQMCLPKGKDPASRSAEKTDAVSSSTRENLALIWRTPHLRVIASVVLLATMASTLVDYQFKEMVRWNLDTTGELTSFFGAFYGWTGGIALIIQLVLATRIIAAAGISLTLALLPTLLLLGSTSFFVLPTLVVITLLRGVDNTFRKSLHRPVLELLYVPLPSMLRRKTKMFVDSVVDSAAEGLGALVVFLWVTLSGLPSRNLTLFVIVLSALFLYMSRRMGREYLDTIVGRLKGEAGAESVKDATDHRRKDLLSASFTRVDLKTLLIVDNRMPERPPEGAEEAPTDPGPLDTLSRLSSADSGKVLASIRDVRIWDADHIGALARLLARDALRGQVADILTGLGGQAVPHLSRLLRDEGTDFVIRRRIPDVLARVDGAQADDALLDALSAGRFEVRYRAAIGLVRRRKRGYALSMRDWRQIVWDAILTETRLERPVWEMRRLLDRFDSADDDLVLKRVGARGELSLEHAFRLMTLVLDPEPVRAAFHGIILNDEDLKSFSLEYLEQVLPAVVRRRLWVFIGDVSDFQRRKRLRPLDQVVSDLMSSRATLFAGDEERAALKRMLGERRNGEGPDAT